MEIYLIGSKRSVVCNSRAKSLNNAEKEVRRGGEEREREKWNSSKKKKMLVTYKNLKQQPNSFVCCYQITLICFIISSC